MKNLLGIAVLMVGISGCALVNSPRRPIPASPAIGMTEADFKLTNDKARLVYLSKDTTVYEFINYSTDHYISLNLYSFVNSRLNKFQAKRDFFKNNTIKVVEPEKPKK